MTDFVPPSLQEVWDWKARADEETRGMSREELIEFYRQAAERFERELGLDLPEEPASESNDAANKGRPSRTRST